MRVDARDPSVLERVAGLPLLLRHARVLARSGTRSVRFFVSDAQRGAAEAILRRAPADLAIEVVAEAPSGPALDGSRVYTAGLEPVGDARTPEGRRAAERELERRIKKSVDLDGVVAYYVIRPLSRVLTRVLLPTRITPNQVTLCALACGLAAALAAARGSALLAGILYWLGAAIDCVDGDLARLRLQGSRLGEWLDTLADDVSTLAVILGLGIGLAADGFGPGWQVFGIVGAGVGLLTAAKLYADLRRLGLPIDTAQYPWFFGAPGAQPGPLGKAFYAVSFLFRRDAFVTVVSVLLVADVRRLALLLLAGGTLVFGILLCAHIWMTRRGQPGDVLATNK